MTRTKIIVTAAAGTVLAAAVATGSLWYGFHSGSAASASTAVTLAANGQPVTDLKIKGNRKSRIYHLVGCPNYGDIADKNVIWFKTKEEAENAGFRMAKNC